MKKQSVSVLKSKCWHLFSEIVRSRDCQKTMNRLDWGKCITCGIIKEFKELQAGHFIPGRHNSVLFDLRNCHAQCYRCNVLLKGNPIKYDRFMLETYGQGTIDELERLDGDSKQFKVFMLQEMLDQFKTIKKTLIQSDTVGLNSTVANKHS